MATGNLSSPDSTTNILNLLNLVKGSKTTTSSNISKEGMDSLIAQILGSANGLGAIASGEKTAGLYGSTTKQLLTNDLVSRSAGELAARKAGTTTKTPAKVGGTDILGLLALSAGKSLLGPTIGGLGKKYGVDKLGDTLSKTLLGGGGGGDFLSNSANFAPLPEPDAIDLFSGAGITDALASFGSELGLSFGSDIGTDVATGIAEEAGGGFLDLIFG